MTGILLGEASGDVANGDDVGSGAAGFFGGVGTGFKSAGEGGGGGALASET
ncbi:hypothetical protein AGMMS49593_00200 [Endomicrobiia bacterium]|nr:hypothetical protein AGMMS49593_00200 [Endomicrobiia bacterium]